MKAIDLSPRERLRLVLSGQLPDRVPVSPFVQDEYLSCYYPQKTTVNRVFDAVELARELEFDLIAKPRNFEHPHFLLKSFPNWELREERDVRDGQLFVKRSIETPSRSLTQVQIGPDAGAASAGVHLSTQEYLLKDREDIEAFIEYMPEIDAETIAEMNALTAQWREALGEDGIAAPWGWCSVFNMVSEYRDIEALIMDTFDMPDLYHALLSKLSGQMAVYNAHLAETEVEWVGIQGNIANGAMFSSDYFSEHVEPYEQPVIDAIHSHGADTIFHNCGAARKLYPNYKRMGFVLWETVSEVPVGDNVLQDAKTFFGDSMCLLGNLDQVVFLKTASPQEVAERTRAIMEIGKPDGHYIFSTSDFLERGTPIENVKAMIGAAKEAGVYGQS
jgi:uroporphyrinogen-III decarboxylase